jgi:tryptophan halogenase
MSNPSMTQLREHFKRLHLAVAKTVDGMPDHGAYLARLVGEGG